MRKKKRAARKSVQNSDKVSKNSSGENLTLKPGGAEEKATEADKPSAPAGEMKTAEKESSQTAQADEADAAVISERQAEKAAADKAAAEKVAAEKAAAEKAAAEKAAAEKAAEEEAEKAAAAAEKLARKEAKERKKAIKALRLSNGKARTLLNMVEIGLAFHDLVKNDDGKIVDYRVREVNPAFETIMALSADDATGNAASSIYGTRGRAPFLKDIVESMESGESRSFEGTVRSIKGRLRFSVQPMDKNLFALLVEDASQDAKVRRRLAFLETRVKNLGSERKELAATLDDAHAEAAAMQQQLKALQGGLDAASKETSHMEAALQREADKTKRLEATVKAAVALRDQLKKATNDLSNVLEVKG